MSRTPQKRIVIVEDNPACAETLEIALEPLGETRVVTSTRDAVRLLYAESAGTLAVVTDFNLPESDGLDLIRRLRGEPRFAHLPILLVSGDSDTRLAERGRMAGADAFFAKPYSPAAVRRKLEELLC